jgi:hypothetical protein
MQNEIKPKSERVELYVGIFTSLLALIAIDTERAKVYDNMKMIDANELLSKREPCKIG